MIKSWPPVRLGEVLTRSTETTVISPDIEYREVTVKLWGKGVVPRGVISGEQIAGSRRFVAKSGQFILSRIDARNGATGIVPSELNGAVVTNDFPLFNPDCQRINTEFLGWLTKTLDFVELCRHGSEGTTNRVRLQEERFLSLEIPLPPLAEQQRTVARIEELAAKITGARSLRQQAVEERGYLYHAYRDVVFQRLARQFGTQRLERVCFSITDGDHNTPKFIEEGTRFIFVGNVSTGRLHFENSKRVSTEYFTALRPPRVPQRGDILYSAVGATLGIPAIVDTDEPFCFQRHIAIIKPNPTLVESAFACHMLRSRTVFRQVWGSTTGSAQPTIPLRAIRDLPIPVPPTFEQRQIVDYLDDLQSKVDALKQLQAETATELDAMLPAILDRAFKGEL